MQLFQTLLALLAAMHTEMYRELGGGGECRKPRAGVRLEDVGGGGGGWI